MIIYAFQIQTPCKRNPLIVAADNFQVCHRRNHYHFVNAPASYTISYTRFAMKKQESPNAISPPVRHQNQVKLSTSCPGTKQFIPFSSQLLFNHLKQSVLTPQASDDVHGKDNRSNDCQLAQDVVGLLCTLVHSNVDLCKVIAVCTGEETGKDYQHAPRDSTRATYFS